MKIKIRKATIKDSDFLFELVNDTEVRKMSFSIDSISLNDHVRWFEERLNNPNTKIYIGLDENDNPAGQIRFDIVGNTAEIDVSISPAFRGRGLGPEIIKMGTERFFSDSIIQKVYAIIKTQNIKSKKSFKRAGFIFNSKEIINGTDCIKLYKERIKNGNKTNQAQ